MSDVQQERRVAFAGMLSRQLPVHPDFRRVKYGLKLKAYRGVLPITRSVESPQIPRGPSIVGKTGVYLPCVRDVYSAPGASRLVSFVPTLLFPGGLGIGAKPPFAAKANCFSECPSYFTRTRLRCKRTNGAGGQGPGLRQKFSTRLHRHTPKLRPLQAVIARGKYNSPSSGYPRKNCPPERHTLPPARTTHACSCRSRRMLGGPVAD